MFAEFFKFELRYWLRGWMVYIFVGIITLLFGLAAGSDFVRIGGAIGNTYRNAPYVVTMWYAAASVFTCFMAAAIYDSAASRDFSSKMSDILFSKPIHKWHYLLGRFSAASIIAVLPAMGISLGIWTAKIANLSDAERWGPFDLMGHLYAILVFAVPNTLLFGAIVFAIASVTRNTLYSFLGLLGLLVVYGVAQSVLGELEYEMLGALSDPFGAAAYDTATKYWTVEDRNTRPIPMTLWLVENRLIWLSVAAMVFFVAGRRFSFDVRTSGKKSKAKSKTIESQPEPLVGVSRPAEGVLPIRTPAPRWLDQFRSTFVSDTISIVKSTTYIFILAFATLNILLGLFLGNQEFYGLYSFPVTYKIVEQVTGSLFIFPVAIITYFTGVLVWRDRDNRFHEITGATPVANSVAATSRFFTMLAVIFPITLIGISAGCLYQVTHGYYRLELNVYFWELIVLQGLRFCFMIVIGLMAHTVSPNKYVGYAVYILFTIINIFLWRWLRWDTLLVRYGAMPAHTYSDMFGFAPYRPALIAFGIYWSSVSVFAIWLTSVIIHRGTPTRLKNRFQEGLGRTSGISRAFAATSLVIAAGLAGWLYYNTHILNELLSDSEVENRQVDYEKTYEKTADIPQPKITDIKYTIDVFPEDRNIRLQATQTIVNKSDGPIDRIYLNTTPRFETEIEIPRAKLVLDDARLNMRTYEMSPPMQVGESLQMNFTVASKNRGIENQVSQPELVQNGTFFNNQIAPQFGYDPNRRLLEAKRREAKGLPKVEPFPELQRECGEVCQGHYLSNDSDWVTVETVISTSQDQTAIAPGSLIKQWQDNGRNYFQYRLDHPSLNFYSFISARYEVDRSKVGDVDTEVYYHADHPWNVSKMTDAIKMTLEYCSKSFGPYKHKQARIIEFPRVASFAQAFPGTMPYSESIGFISNLEKPDDIDMVHYVVAHEMGHQWWAHQVIGARMQGATVLSESLAQYTALMVMKQKYGKEMMHKFLEFEMDRYLRSRGTEQLKERPLASVDPNQGYIHYQKGGIVLFHLAEMIGEERVNAALQSIIQKYAYQGPPYPNSYVLIDALKAHTPEELHYLIKDLFEQITLYGNKTLEATATKTEDGKYRVKIKVECEKLNADSKGKETSVAMDDWLEIGAFSKPEPGQRYGKLLHRQRVQLSSGVHELEFTVDSRPDKAGIDPQHLLIDRMPKDNLKTVEIKEG